MVRAKNYNEGSEDDRSSIVITEIRLSKRQKQEFAACAEKRAAETMVVDDWRELRSRSPDPLKADIDMICRDAADIKTEGSK